MSKLTELHSENIKLLVSKGKTTREIASILGIGKSTVQAISKREGYIKNETSLSNEQKQVLIGTIIGDGCLFKSTPNSNARLNLAHSLKQEEYFYYKYNILKDLIRSEPAQRKWLDKRTGNEYSEIRFQSRVNVLFTELWLDSYKDGKKVITDKMLEDCGELTLAIKFFDDGCKSSNAHYIAMNDYDSESIEVFRKWLLDRFCIESKLHKGGSLYMPAKENEKLCKILMKYATDDVYYKI